MLIQKEAIADYLAKPLDSFVWMKKLQREQLEKKMREWPVRPEFRTDPWLHQLVCFYIGMHYPEFLFLLDMGAGKTKILLDLFTQKVREKEVQRGLIMVPRLINLGSWEQAILNHSNFGPNIVEGTIAEKWEQLVNPRHELTVIDYAGLQLALGKKQAVKGKKKNELVKDDAKLRQLRSIYQFAALDESHKAKGRETMRFALLRALMRAIPHRYSTTGTLFGSNPEDAWAQFFLIDRGETFGDTIGIFRAAFFNEVQNRWKAYPDYSFNKGMTREFYKRLNHRSIRYTEEECTDIPPRKVILVPLVLPDEQREHYNRAVQGLIESKGKLKELDSNYIRMRQILGGFLQWKDEDEKCQVIFKNNPKLDYLEKLVFESGDSKLVVSYEYTQSGKLITERLAALGIGFEWLYGNSKDPRNAVKRFLENRDCRVFVMNSEAGGTGTDGLQDQAHYLAMYENPPSPITRQQVIKRVHRPGQARRCFIYDLTYRKTYDEKLLADLAEGRDLHKRLVDGSFDVRQLLLA